MRIYRNSVRPVLGAGESCDPQASATGEIFVTEDERERNVMARVGLDNISSTTWAVLVDLSDTVNFRHDRTGAVHLSYIGMQVDRENTASGRFQLGVVTRVDGSNGDVTFLRAIMFEKSSDTSFIRLENLAPSQMKCGVSGGALTHIVAGPKVTNDTALQTDVLLTSPRGSATVAPGVGDIVVRVLITGSGTCNAIASVLYHTEDQ